MAITEIFGVKIEKNPPQSRLDELGVTTWTKWGCEQPTKIPWTFPANETTYLLDGKVKVYVDGHEGCIELGGGDLASFPKGMKIIWEVIEAVNKYYREESDANNPLTSSDQNMAITEIFGVKIEKNPPQSRLDELGVTTWTKWGCEQPTKIPWTFPANETTYLLDGKVKVYVDGHEGCIELGGGDLASFPKGMKIIWEVIEAVNKYYREESDANDVLLTSADQNMAAMNKSLAAN